MQIDATEQPTPRSAEWVAGWASAVTTARSQVDVAQGEREAAINSTTMIVVIETLQLAAERDSLALQLASAQHELDKWRNYQPDDYTLAELKKQYGNGESIAARRIYVVALESTVRNARALLESAYCQLGPIYLDDGVTLHPGCVSTLHELYEYLWPEGKAK